MTRKHSVPDRGDQISSYLDGALSAADTLTFEAEMERDPALAEAVLRWQSNDSALKHAFDAPMLEPISDEMLERLGLAETSTASNIIDFKSAQEAKVERSRAHDFVAQWRWPLAGALAASLVALVTFGPQFSNIGPFDVKTSKLFQIAMQESPSSVLSKVENGENVSPTLSFVDGAGRFCREFALTVGGMPESGVACRAGGKWQIEATVKGAPDISTTGEIRAANGAAGNSLDPVYARLNASDPMGADEEKSKIANGWK